MNDKHWNYLGESLSVDADIAIREALLLASRTKTKDNHKNCAWCSDPTEDGSEFCSYGPDSCAVDARRYADAKARMFVK